MRRSVGTRQIFLLHPDARFQELVRSSLPQGFGCWTLPDWEALRETARHASPSDLTIVDPHSGSTDGELCDELPGFIREFPWLPVVAAVSCGGSEARERLLTLGRWGVSEVILLGVEDTQWGIARAVRFAQGRVMQGLLADVLPPYLTGRARRLLFAAAEATAVGGHAPDLAALLGVTETTVMRRCERLRLPPPRRILAWMRILLAAKLLEESGRTAQSVASACGYATEAGLRRVVLNFLGIGVTELRRRGPLPTAAAAFVRDLRECRDGAGASEAP